MDGQIKEIIDKLESLEEKIEANRTLLVSLDTYVRNNGLSERVKRNEERIERFYRWLFFSFLGVIVLSLINIFLR